MAEDFFSNLAQTMQSPQMQSALMSISGTPYEVQQPILRQQAQNQASQQEQQARAMLEQIMSKGDLTDEDVLRVFTISPELGKALVSMRNPELTAQQNKAQALIAQGYDPKIANDISLGLIKDAVDARGRPIRINMGSGEILPVGDAAPVAPQSTNWTTEFEEPVTNLLTNEPTSQEPPVANVMPDIESIAQEQGLDLTNPIDAKTAKNIFDSRMKQYETQSAEQEKSKGISRFDNILTKLNTDLAELKTENLIPSESASTLDNISNYLAGTGIGQEIERAKGSRKSTLEDTSKSLRLRLMQAIMQATGMSSKQIDSNAELKAMLDSFGSPTSTYEARKAILDSIKQSYGSGGELPSPEPQGLPEGARQAPDGNYYVEKNGKFFKVNPR